MRCLGQRRLEIVARLKFVNQRLGVLAIGGKLKSDWKPGQNCVGNLEILDAILQNLF